MDQTPSLGTLPNSDASESSSLDLTTFFMSSVHDMKNSLSVMSAFLENALGELAANDPAREMSLQALYEAQRVNNHLIQILALYKINVGLYPFDPLEVNLAHFTDEVVGRVMPLATAKGVAIEFEICGNERTWYFDHDLIVSVVVQALYNAIRYTKSRIRLGLSAREGMLEIRVDDDGAGFPSFMLQADFPSARSIDMRTGSTGLGLFFSSKVANIHRHGTQTGRSRIENGGKFGGGSFVLVLP